MSQNLVWNAWVRISTIVALATLLVWLALSPPPTVSKWQAIDKELKKGTIGKLNASQEKLLEETLSWLLPTVGISTPYVVNGKSQPGKLHIYITTPDAYEITGCARGNALYDAQLDVIFIDEQILYPSEILHLGENSPGPEISIEEFTFIPVYLRFIILHELGHRQLHKKSGGAFFDFSNGSRKIEEEADNFAVAKLVDAYKTDLKAGGKQIGVGAGQYIQLETNKLKDSERVWADLIGSVSSMSVLMMFSSSDFSTFYEDAAHPNFINRANSILKASLKASEIGPDLKARAAIYLEYLNRMQSLSRFNFTEIHVPVGSQRVCFEKNQLVILGNDGSLFNVSLQDINHKISDKGGALTISSTAISKLNLKGNPDSPSMSKIWAHPKTGIIILQPLGPENNGEVEVHNIKNSKHGYIASLKSALKKDSIGNRLFRPIQSWMLGGTDFDNDVFLPPQPSVMALLRTGEKWPKEIIVIKEGKLIHQVDILSLKRHISEELSLNSIDFEISTITDQVAYLSVFEVENNHNQLVGTAEFNLQTGKLDKVIKLNFVDSVGNNMNSVANDKLVIVPGKVPRYILFTRNRTEFITFELSTNKPAKQLAKTSFLFDMVLKQRNLNSDVLGAFDPILTSAEFVPPNYACIKFNDDSVYFLNTNTGKVTTLLSPGNFIKSSISSTGLIAFYVHNGRKIYILKSTEIL